MFDDIQSEHYMELIQKISLLDVNESIVLNDTTRGCGYKITKKCNTTCLTCFFREKDCSIFGKDFGHLGYYYTICNANVLGEINNMNDSDYDLRKSGFTVDIIENLLQQKPSDDSDDLWIVDDEYDEYNII